MELCHDTCGTLPISFFGGQLLFPPARDRVDLDASPCARRSPFGRNPPMLLKLQERGVERPLVDDELVGADLLDPSGNRVAMQGPHRVERLQHDEIKRAVKEVRLVGWHVLGVYTYDVLSGALKAPTGPDVGERHELEADTSRSDQNQVKYGP